MNAEIHTLTGAYAADAQPPDERVAFERHLSDCDACAQEVRELTETTARLGLAVAAAPPAQLKQRVMAEIRSVRQLPPLVADGAQPHAGDDRRNDVAASGPRRRRPPARPWRWAALRSPLGIAAGVLLAISLGLGGFAIAQHRQLDDARQRNAVVASILAAPDRIQGQAQVASGGTVTVVAADGQAVFSADGLAPLPDDRVYQLWVQRDGKLVSAGLLDVHDGRAQALVRDLGTSRLLALSVERAGGSPVPTNPVAQVSAA